MLLCLSTASRAATLAVARATKWWRFCLSEHDRGGTMVWCRAFMYTITYITTLSSSQDTAPYAMLHSNGSFQVVVTTTTVPIRLLKA